MILPKKMINTTAHHVQSHIKNLRTPAESLHATKRINSSRKLTINEPQDQLWFALMYFKAKKH
jgi:hypothetical protein